MMIPESAFSAEVQPAENPDIKSTDTQQKSGRRGPAWVLPTLVVAGLAILTLLVALLVLYVNVPPGRNVPYGLSLDSVSLFRTLWAYPAFSLDPQQFSIVAILTILALWGTYLSASFYVLPGRLPSNRRAITRVIVVFTLLFNGILVLVMPPVLSSDIYDYALFGRMVSLYDLNPYLTSGNAISSDRLSSFAVWTSRTTVYGPTWTFIAAGVTALSGQSILLTTILFKATAAVLSLANCLLVFLVARRLGSNDGLRALMLYAWNPLVLVETAGTGHNDVALVTFALLGLLLATHRRLNLGLVLLVLSVLVKYFTALLLVLYVAHCVSRQRSWQRMAVVMASMAATAAVVVGVLYLPFWPGLRALGRLITGLQPSVITMTNPLRLLLDHGAARLFLSNGVVEQEAQMAAHAWVTWGLNAAFVVLMLLLLRRAVDRGAGWLQIMPLWGVASLVYIFLVFGGTYPWYLISMIAIVAIGPADPGNRRLTIWTMGLGVLLMAGYAVVI